MFIFTTRLTRRKLFICIGAAIVLICSIVMLVSDDRTAEAAAADELPSRKNVKTTEERVAFLAAYGWQTDKDAEMSQEVIIPKEFDEAFEEYNAIQKTEEFDLTKYKGKRVMRYVYPVANHPEKKDMVYASILIYKNKVIGGDIQCSEPDGFMHGFSMPETESGEQTAEDNG